jgi:hypothetical protein
MHDYVYEFMYIVYCLYQLLYFYYLLSQIVAPLAQSPPPLA